MCERPHPAQQRQDDQQKNDRCDLKRLCLIPALQTSNTFTKVIHSLLQNEPKWGFRKTDNLIFNKISSHIKSAMTPVKLLASCLTAGILFFRSIPFTSGER